MKVGGAGDRVLSALRWGKPEVKMGSDDPVRSDAAVAAAATLYYNEKNRVISSRRVKAE